MPESQPRADGAFSSDGAADAAIPPATWEAFWSSPEARRDRPLNVIVLTLALLSAVSAFFWIMGTGEGFQDTDYDRSNIVVITQAALLGLGGFFSLVLAYRVLVGMRAFEERVDEERRSAAERALDDLALESALIELLRRNRKVLSEYQAPVRRQAVTSYTYSQVAMAVGLIVIVGGIIAVLATPTVASKITVGGLAATAAALSGFIAKTYLRVYEKAQDQLNYYFDEPLVTSYLLNAERLADAISDPDLKDRSYALMVEHIARSAVPARRVADDGVTGQRP